MRIFILLVGMLFCNGTLDAQHIEMDTTFTRLYKRFPANGKSDADKKDKNTLGTLATRMSNGIWQGIREKLGFEQIRDFVETRMEEVYGRKEEENE